MKKYAYYTKEYLAVTTGDWPRDKQSKEKVVYSSFPISSFTTCFSGQCFIDGDSSIVGNESKVMPTEMFEGS